MYPAQTSFIPVTVALARFADNFGFDSWFPYWYLGVPFRYLTGPVVPGLLVALQNLFGVPYFTGAYLVIFLAFILGPAGWGVLAWKLSGQKFYGLIVFLLTAFLPWHILSGLLFSETSAVLGAALVPWVLWAFAHANKLRMLNIRIHSNNSNSHYISIIPSLLFSLALLTNTLSFLPILVGSILLQIILGKKWEQWLVKILFIFGFSLLLTFWWYSPGYWLTILGAPSFGGVPVFQLVGKLADIFRAVVPILLAVAVVFWQLPKRNTFVKFTFGWLGIFALLTLFRFLSDPDFWQDWTAFFPELEIGAAFIVTHLMLTLFTKAKQSPTEELMVKNANFWRKLINYRKLPIIASLALIFGLIFASSLLYNRVGRPKLLSQNLDKPIGEFLMLIEENVPRNERIFLSGTSAFWLNSKVDRQQTRGGVDQAATHPFWDQATFQITKGEDGKLARMWLEALGVRWILVHSWASSEFYHDFTHPEKFAPPATRRDRTRSLLRVLSSGEDTLYMLPEASLAWVSDAGSDKEALEAYLASRLRPAKAKWLLPSQLEIEADARSGEAITVAVTWDPGWRVDKGKIERDSLGQVRITGASGKILLYYKNR